MKATKPLHKNLIKGHGVFFSTMKKDVTFIDTEGRTINLSKPMGGPDAWHIYVNRYYNGLLVFKNGQWGIMSGNDDEFTADYADPLGQWLEE